MKTTGITRRVDELGRIVIPKEIRKNMRLKAGELLEIFLNDSETITLKKHSIIDKKQEFLMIYAKTLADQINADVYITNLNEIIFSNNNDSIGEKLSDDIESKIKVLNFNGLEEIKITNNIRLSKPFYIYSLSPNGDISGLLIVKFKNNNSDKSKLIIKFSTAFLEDYLENN